MNKPLAARFDALIKEALADLAVHFETDGWDIDYTNVSRLLIYDLLCQDVDAVIMHKLVKGLKKYKVRVIRDKDRVVLSKKGNVKAKDIVWEV